MTYQGQNGSLRPASPLTALVMVSALLVTVLVAVVLGRLHDFDGVPEAFVVSAAVVVFGGAWSLAAVVAGEPDPAGARVPRGAASARLWTLLLLTVLELIGVSGLLAEMTIDDNRIAVVVAVSVAAGCIIGFFAVIQAILSFPFKWFPPRGRVTAILAVITAILAVSAAPGRAPVLPGDAGRSASPAPLLAVCVLCLLSGVLTGHKLRFVTAKPPDHRRPSPFRSRIVAPLVTLTALPETGPPARRAVMPAFAALVFFALTRDMSLSIGLLAGGLAVLIATNQASHRRADSPAGRELATSLRCAGVGGVLFAVLCWPVMLAGQALGAQGFDPWSAFGYSQSRPATFIFGQGMGVGPGWQFRFLSGTNGGADVLATIGRETGFLGLLLLLAAYVAAFGALVLLATKIAKGTAPAALAWGLITLLLAQFVLSVATLAFPGQVALGEGPPLLVDSWIGYPTALLSVAIVIGLAWRAVYLQPPLEPAPPGPVSPEATSPSPTPVQNAANPGKDLP